MNVHVFFDIQRVKTSVEDKECCRQSC